MNGEELSRALLHDSSACFRFVKSTAAACELGGGFPSYLDSTRRLLEHLKELSKSTQDSLLKSPSESPDDPSEYRRKRQLLHTIREAWRSVHFYVQPAADADTLHVPTALVQMLTRRVQLLTKCESLDFAVVHTDKLNYFQFPPEDFSQAVNDLSEIVSVDSSYLSQFGLIALPHSQSRHLFLNSLLAHEIGHIVFSRLKCIDRIEAPISEGLKKAFSRLTGGGIDPFARGQLPGVLQDWAEETFCDLFGVHLIGPSFVFASIEFFDLGKLLAADGSIDERAAIPQLKFEPSHPARLFRLWRQTALLESLGWWDVIGNSPSHYVRILEGCRNLRGSEFSYETIPDPQGRMAVDAFLSTIECIETEVATVTKALKDDKGRANEINEFEELCGPVCDYLRDAIVPSTLCTDKGFRSPSAVVLLNAAHLFYLSGIGDLISKSDKPDSSNLEQRDVWMERVEDWATKALEDIALPVIGGTN